MYAPLAFMAKSEQPGREFEARREQFVNECGLTELQDMTLKEYLDFFMFYNFLDETCVPPKFRRLAKMLYLNIPVVMLALGISPDDLKEDGLCAYTEWKDVQLAPVLMECWGRNKQVYKPDADFAAALLLTEHLTFTKQQMEHLPVNDFYVDLENCPYFAPSVGAFIHIRTRETRISINIYMLTKDLYFFSFYTEGVYGRNGCIELDMNEIPDEDYKVVFPFLANKHGGSMNLEYSLSKKSLVAFLMQLICYLSSKEPQITDDPVTKSTYRPSRTVRNKFSEVQSHEVGVRYGKAIRAGRTGKRNGASAGQPDETKERSDTRKPVSPHWRCAHWHHFWTGKGRTNYEVRWIEPTFVGPGESENSDVVIHKVVT